MPCIANNLIVMRHQMEMMEQTCAKEKETFKTMSDKIERLELEAKGYEVLINSKDKYLDEKDAEIEKLQTIISNMEDGEGVVDFVNDFVKKDEDLVAACLNKLKDEEKAVEDYRIGCYEMGYSLSTSFMRNLQIEIDGMTLPKIRDIQGNSQMVENYFKTEIPVDDIVKTINYWRGGHLDKTAILVGRSQVIYKQNDLGNLMNFNSGVKVYSTKDVTKTDIVENPSLYINAFLKITKPGAPETGVPYFHDTINDGFGRAFDYEQKIVVQHDFQLIEDEGSGDLIMSLDDIWYQSRDPEVRIVKRYRNSERIIFLKCKIGSGHPSDSASPVVLFSWSKDW